MRKWAVIILLSLAVVGCGKKKKAKHAEAEPVETVKTETVSKPRADLIKETLVTYNAGWNAHSGDQIAGCYASGAVFMRPGVKGSEEESVKDVLIPDIKNIFAAFPSSKMVVRRKIISEKVVVQEWYFSGTHSGTVAGIAATNKPVGYAGISVFSFDASGKIEREHLYWDDATLLTQIGALGGMKKRSAGNAGTTQTEEVVAAGANQEVTNAQNAKAFYEAVGKQDWKAVDGLLADDVVYSDVSAPEDLKGKANVGKQMIAFSKAFPDLSMAPQNALAAGKYVFVEGNLAGTMKGPLGPLKPTNKNGVVHFADVIEFNDAGKITRFTTYNSSLEFTHVFLSTGK
ncbi:MAG: nuclear transport factor 2 family protein [Polyangiaceae bacterium]